MDSLDCKVRELLSNMNYIHLIQETLGRLQQQGKIHIFITIRSTDVIEL
jgi:hypothetical protein